MLTKVFDYIDQFIDQMAKRTSPLVLLLAVFAAVIGSMVIAELEGNSELAIPMFCFLVPLAIVAAVFINKHFKFNKKQ